MAGGYGWPASTWSMIAGCRRSRTDSGNEPGTLLRIGEGTSLTLSHGRYSLAYAVRVPFPRRMELAWLDPAAPDQRDVDGAVALQAAAQLVDAPEFPTPMVSSFLANLRYGWEDNAADTAVLRDPRGRVIGLLEVWLPKWDNQHLGAVHVIVDPLMRRRGMGKSLAEAGVRHVIRAGRRLVTAFTRDDEASIALCRSFGLKQSFEEIV